MNKTLLLIPMTMLMAVSSCSSNASKIYTSSDPSSSSINSSVISSSSNNHFELYNGYKDYLGNNPRKTYNNQISAIDVNYVSSVQSFSSDFLNALQKENNNLFSPVSIATCFSMLLDGTANNSKLELEHMLHYDDSFDHLEAIKNMLLNSAIKEGEEAYLDIAQSLWIDNSFKEGIDADYVSKMTDYYFAELFHGDLKSSEMHKALANYINDKTNNFLKLTEKDFEDMEGILWLLNTIYTKAEWVKEFPENNNHEGTFYNLDKSQSKATYMNRTAENALYYETDNYYVSSLPLKHSLNFNILLPKTGSDYQKVLNDKEALNYMYNFKNLRIGNYSEIIYNVPKFEDRRKYDLTNIMPTLGVNDIFSSDLADLSAMGAAGCYVGKAIHEAGIKVDNKGVEAAAYTIIEVDKSSVGNNVVLSLNHPFAYSICDSNGLPLFVGVINKL